MKKSFLNTLVLVGVFGALLAWYLVYEKKIRLDNTKEEDLEKQFVTLDAKDIHELEYSNSKPYVDEKNQAATATQIIKLRKVGEEWTVVEPLQVAADASVIGSLITTLTTTKNERVVEENAQDLEKYGLKTPLLTVTVRKDSSSPSQSFQVGKDTPTGFSVYVKPSDRATVYRAPKTLKTSFDKDVTAIRDKSIFAVSRFDISEVELKVKNEEFLLKKDEKDNWMLAREGIPADANEWNKTLNALLDAKAIAFAADKETDLTKFGLKNPSVRVVVTKTKDKERVGLSLGESSDKLVYAKLDNKVTVFKVERDVLVKAMRPAKEYRSMKLAAFNRFDIARVKLERGKEILELFKEGQNVWKLATDPVVEADFARVDAFLSKLQETKILDYNPKEKAGALSGQLTVRMFEKKDEKETEAMVLTFAAGANKRVSVERAGASVPFWISADDYARINLAKPDFLKPPSKAPEKSE